MEIDNMKNKFEFAQLRDHIKDEAIKGEAIGFFKDAMIRFCHNKASVVAGIIISIIVVFAIIGPLFGAYPYKEQHVEWAYLPPRIPGLEKIGICDGTKVIKVKKESIQGKYKDSLVKVEREFIENNTEMADIKVSMYKVRSAEDQYFWFGSDALGRSQWTRIWRGARISLLIALIAVSVNVTIGIIYGSISGYYGGRVDMIMQRLIEIIGGVPELVIIILFILRFGTGIAAIAFSMVMTGWIGTSRMVRAQFYRYKGQEYVLASRTMGASDKKIIFRHILPNAIGPIITATSLAIPAYIFAEAFLAYLGLGLQAPEPSIGVLLAEGQKDLLQYPHLTVFPGIVICILMISFNLLGNGLRDAFNPTLRGN